MNTLLLSQVNSFRFFGKFSHLKRSQRCYLSNIDKCDEKYNHIFQSFNQNQQNKKMPILSNGLCAVYKPPGFTSSDVVQKVKYYFHRLNKWDICIDLFILLDSIDKFLICITDS